MRLTQLEIAWQRSADRLSGVIAQRDELLKEMVGPDWVNGRPNDEKPVNFLRLARNVIVQNCLSGELRAGVSTAQARLRPSAADTEAALSLLLKVSGFTQTTADIFDDALLCFGVRKIGSTTDVKLPFFDVSEPFYERISPSDFVLDMTATDFRAAAFYGNRYRVPSQSLQGVSPEDGWNPAAIEAMTAASPGQTDTSGRRRVSPLFGNEWVGDEEELGPMLNLVDVYHRESGLMLTMPEPGFGMWDRSLRRIAWEGPNRRSSACYDMLCLDSAPDSPVGLSVLGVGYDLHRLASRLFEKIGDASLSQKTLGYTNGDATSAKLFTDAKSGDCIAVNGGPPGVFSFPGADAGTVAAFRLTQQWLSYIFGNLDALGGLAQQGGTATQESIITRGANNRIQSFQRRLKEFANRALRDFVWWLWQKDQNAAIPASREYLGVQIPASRDLSGLWGPIDRQTAFNDLNFEIEAHSYTGATPAEKLQALLQYYSVFSGNRPMLLRNGVDIDDRYVLQQIARLSGIPEISGMFMNVAPVRDVIGTPDGGPPNPNKPNGNYVRQNVGSSDGFGDEIASLMSSAGHGSAGAA